METLSCKARFDALAELIEFDEGCVSALRLSINHLLPEVQSLVRRLDERMKCDVLDRVIGEVDDARADKLKSLLASFVMRTINCNFDEDYCDYVVEVASGDNVPDGFFSFGLTLTNDFICQTLPGAVEDRAQLTSMLAAWNRVTAILKEITRKP